MDNGQGKEIIYRHDHSAGAEAVNNLIDEIDGIKIQVTLIQL